MGAAPIAGHAPCPPEAGDEQSLGQTIYVPAYAVATVLGIGVARLWGWTFGTGKAIQDWRHAPSIPSRAQLPRDVSKLQRAYDPQRYEEENT